MNSERTQSVWQAVLPVLLLVLAGILFALQLRSLFVFPEPNSIRWFGDETWLMTEARQQIATGVVTYPLAIGSQLAHGKGLVLSLTWLSSLLYGVPILIAGGDPVLVGRIVTAILALALLILLYGASRLLGASRFASAAVVLLLVATRSFFFASHSARPDLLAGLIVLCAVAFLVKNSSHEARRSAGWWLAYGGIFAFLAVSSSIHLLTLLLPLVIVFCWMIPGKSRGIHAFLWSVAGAVTIFALFSIVYYDTTGSLALFPPSARSGQFHDVLTAIPILRPFSRSVQVANIIIRFKQFAAEAPEIFLLPILLPFAWRREPRHTLTIATGIVFLSWLLLQGAEINYLMHILPLLFLCLAIAITRFANRWQYSKWVFTLIGTLAFLFGIRDSTSALANGTVIDRSNRSAIGMIQHAIDSTWDGLGKPLVLTEPPTLDRLSQDSSIRVMTDHFLSFPERAEPIDSFLARERVNYAVLYNSHAYPKNRPQDDPFYQSVEREGNLIGKYVGRSGDIGRSYFHASDWMDTVLIFKLNKPVP